MKEIAQHPENRFDTWILKTWRVLPTSPDFINLTEEQRELLWQDYLIDNPEIAKKINQANDTDFQDEWEKMDKDNPDAVDFEDKGYDIDLAAKMEKFVQETNLDEIERSPRAKELLKQMQNKQPEENSGKIVLNSADWEEVDLDSEDW